MVVRTPVEIKPDEEKREIERELANFVKRENELIARGVGARRTAWPSSIKPLKRYGELTATIQRPLKLAGQPVPIPSYGIDCAGTLRGACLQRIQGRPGSGD